MLLRWRIEDLVLDWILCCPVATQTGIQGASLHLTILAQIFGELISPLLSPFRLFLVKTSQYIANFHPEGALALGQSSLIWLCV